MPFIKLSYAGNIRRIEIEHYPDFSFSRLINVIKQTFDNLPEDWNVLYEDTDGDKIMICSQKEYKSALSYLLEEYENVKFEIVPKNNTSKNTSKNNAPNNNTSNMNCDLEFITSFISSLGEKFGTEPLVYSFFQESSTSQPFEKQNNNPKKENVEKKTEPQKEKKEQNLQQNLNTLEQLGFKNKDKNIEALLNNQGNMKDAISELLKQSQN